MKLNKNEENIRKLIEMTESGELVWHNDGVGFVAKYKALVGKTLPRRLVRKTFRIVLDEELKLWCSDDEDAFVEVPYDSEIKRLYETIQKIYINKLFRELNSND